MTRVTVQQRLALTAAGDRLVLDTDPAAVTLWSIPGRQVPAEEAERFGLVDGALPEDQASSQGEPTGEKAQPKGEDKALHAADDKGVRAPARKQRSGSRS